MLHQAQDYQKGSLITQPYFAHTWTHGLSWSSRILLTKNDSIFERKHIQPDAQPEISDIIHGEQIDQRNDYGCTVFVFTDID